MFVGNTNVRIACDFILSYDDLVCSIANKLGITTLHIHLTHVAHLSSPMATFPNTSSNCIAHIDARKINTCYFFCNILEAQDNHKYKFIFSYYVQFQANLQGFRTKYGDCCNI